MNSRPCLVIGASGNIGEAIAHRLIGEGRPVALTHSLNSKPAPSLVDIEGKGKWYAVEVRDSKSVNQLVADVQKDFNAAPDLVYVAGIAQDAGITRLTDESWEAVVSTNLTGAFYATRAVSRSLMLTGGRIIYFGSIVARRGNVGQISYAASKGALESMARVVAQELGRFGVTCNVIAPGAIKSKMLATIPEAAVESFIKATPLRRLGLPTEVAALVSYLLSEEGQFVTGQSIYIDGGLSAV